MGIHYAIEVFTQDCCACAGFIAYAQELAASRPGSTVRVWDVTQQATRARMRALHLVELPAIVVDSVPLPCCSLAPNRNTPI